MERRVGYKLVNFSKIVNGPVVHEVYHRGHETRNSTYLMTPSVYIHRTMTAAMPGRVECVEPSPHYAYAYTV